MPISIDHRNKNFEMKYRQKFAFSSLYFPHAKITGRITVSFIPMYFSVTRDLLFAVLQFPDNYLVDPDVEKLIDDDEHYSWSHRSIQLESLRKLCIPEVVLLLHKVLHLAGEYKECVRLADELANECHQLYKVYSKHKLAELIGKISESSLALMNEKMDPWGYAIDV